MKAKLYKYYNECYIKTRGIAVLIIIAVIFCGFSNEPQNKPAVNISVSDENITKFIKFVVPFLGIDADTVEYSDGKVFFTDKNGEDVCYEWNGNGFVKVSNEVHIIAAGDNLIHSAIYKHALKKYGSFDFLYRDIKDTAKAADFAIINQETPLVDEPSLYSGYPCFGTPKTIADSIKDAGFDAVTLSTNHMFDKGARGIETTNGTFDDLGIIRIGGISDCPYSIVEINGIKLALLSYTYGTNGIPAPKGYDTPGYLLKDEDKIREDIKNASGLSDAVIVFPHWGTEYSKNTDSMQKKWTKLFYSCGVTAVIGTHPHVLEGYEMYSEDDNGHEMLVYYSLGNFVSTNRVTGHNSGGIADFTLKKTRDGVKVSSYNLTEINTDGLTIISNDID